MTPEELYSAHERLVWYVLNRFYPTFLGDEDLAQEARIGLWKACLAYDPERGAFSTLAVRSIRNEVRCYFRNQQRHDIPPDKLLSMEVPVKYAGADIPVRLKDILAGEPDIQWSDLSGLLDKLDDTNREILRLRLRGASLQEISTQVGISRQAICKRLEKIEDMARRYL